MARGNMRPGSEVGSRQPKPNNNMKKLLLLVPLFAFTFAPFVFSGCSTVKETNRNVNDASSTTNSSLNAADRANSTAKRLTK
jgi:hypothetical protein